MKILSIETSCDDTSIAYKDFSSDIQYAYYRDINCRLWGVYDADWLGGCRCDLALCDSVVVF